MLIGLHGKMGAGKDQTFKFIQEWVLAQPFQPYRIQREAFADRLKISAARALGVTGSTQDCIDFCNRIKQPGVLIEVWDTSSSTEPVFAELSGREYLQYYGTEAHREVFHPDFWINAVMDTYNPLAPEILVVTDVRFANEAEAIRHLGGHIVHIIRDDQERGDAHASEQTLPKSLIDSVLFNDGDLSQLQSKAVGLVQDLWPRPTRRTALITEDEDRLYGGTD